MIHDRILPNETQNLNDKCVNYSIFHNYIPLVNAELENQIKIRGKP